MALNSLKLTWILESPGELLGTRQAGLPNFLIFNHSDFAHLVEPAKIYAKRDRL